MRIVLRIVVLTPLLIILTTWNTIARKTVHVDSVFLYNKFLAGGSTTGLLGAFNNPATYGSIDTTIYKLTKKELLEWTNSLSTSKSRRHWQMKIAGIEYAGEIYLDGGPKHFFIYLASVKLLIDLAGKREYLLDSALNIHN